MKKSYNYTDETLKDWSNMLHFFDIPRTEIWKILGYKKQGGYDTKLTNMKKNGKLSPALQLCVDIWKTMSADSHPGEQMVLKRDGATKK